MRTFRFRLIDIHVLLSFLKFSLCYLSLLVPACLSHITWSCTRVTAWAHQLALLYVLAGLLSDNPASSCPDPGVWIVVTLLYLIRVAQRKRGLAVAGSDPFSSSLPLIGSRDSHFANREYFPVFHIVHPAYALLGYIIFLIYYIMLCDNCVLVLLLLECILLLYFRTLILACTDA